MKCLSCNNLNNNGFEVCDMCEHGNDYKAQPKSVINYIVYNYGRHNAYYLTIAGIQFGSVMFSESEAKAAVALMNKKVVESQIKN